MKEFEKKKCPFCGSENVVRCILDVDPILNLMLNLDDIESYIFCEDCYRISDRKKITS